MSFVFRKKSRKNFLLFEILTDVQRTFFLSLRSAV